MNEITPYEQLIAAKLDEAPVPDMADSIWSGIQLRLDALDGIAATDPAPLSGRPGATAQTPAAPAKGFGWYGVAAIVAVVFLLWWYFSHMGPKETMPHNILPERHAPMPVEPSPVEDSPASGKPARKKTVPPMPAGIKKDTVLLRNVPTDGSRADPAAGPLLPPPRPDSSAVQPNKPALPDVDLYTTPAPRPTPRGKKPRGVKGISDDDYKLTATKDSGRKKN